MTGKIATFAAALALLVLLGAADVASATATESAGSRADLVAKLTPNGRQVLSTLAVGAVAPSGESTSRTANVNFKGAGVPVCACVSSCIHVAMTPLFG